MTLRAKLLLPLILVGFALHPGAESADAAEVNRVSLSVTGSGSSATFTVRSTLYWSVADWLNNTGVYYEVRFYGVDGGSMRLLAAWTHPREPGNTLQETVTVVAGNSTRWANEDSDSWFFNRRDEIVATVRLYDADGNLITEAESNQVTGNF